MGETFWEFMRFYQKFLSDRWNYLEPTEYGIVLTVIGAIGWWLMQFKKR